MKKFIRIYLIFIMIFATRIYASEVIDCTVSDAYIEWSNLSPEEKSKYITPEYCESYGLDDNFEIVNDEEEGVVTNKKMLTVSYPSKYVSVSTPVKNQKYTQTCWAFSSTTVLESHILKNYDVLTEFSPGHMNYMESLSFYNFVNTHSRIRYVNDGGNFTDAAMYYINKYGPVLESEYNTNTETDVLPFVYPETIIGAKNIIEVNDIEYDYRTKSGACTSNEKNKIKSLIYNYGPTGASMFMDNLYLSNYSYIYKSTNKNVTTNHGVTIIGWDDNYSTSNFSGRFKPSKNGAWIVQNSYGTSFGDNGIFYISYEDDEICTNIFSIRNIDPYITDNRYITSEQRALSTTALTTQMSVFSKKSSVNEYLTKVSFEVMKPTNYKVYYYAGDAKKDNVKTSKMKLIASGSVDYTGWISVVPSKSITIPKGVKKYSIAVYQSNKLTGLARNIQKVYNSYENKTKNYYSPEKYKKNVSFVYDNGKWRDTYSYFSGNNYKTTINSFTDNIYVDYNSVSVNYSYNDYFDVSYSIKALMNGKITSVRLIKGNNVIASKDINLNVEAGKSYDLSLRKSGLSNFVNGEYDLQVFLSNGIYRGIKVKINVLPISGIKITNKTGLELEVGNTLKLNTEITPSNHNSTDPTLTWTSSNNNIASVDGNGVVTGKKGGHVTISVKTKNNITASYELEVIKSITDLSVNRTKLYFDSDTPQNIWFFVSPSDTTFDKHVTWSSSDQEKVSIEYIDEENIRVKPLSSGIVTLTATTVNGISKNVEVQIKGLSVEPNKLKLELNNSYNLNGYVVEGYDNISYDVTYSSSNPSVATVDENGKVTAKKLGTTIITVTDKYNRTVTSEVEVIKIQASSFSVSSISTKTYNGKSIKPSVTVKYKGKTLKKDKIYTISYSNNKNPGKAKVKITAKKSNLYEGSKTVYFIIKPKKVTIKTPTTSSKTITVKYSKQTKVSGYEVSYRLKGSSSWTTVKASGASKKITGLKKGKTYQVRVRSYVMVDNKKYSGAWSKTKSIKCK